MLPFLEEESLGSSIVVFFLLFLQYSLCFGFVSYTFCIASCIIVHHERHVYIPENEIMLLVIDAFVVHDAGLASLGSF